ncbi:MAG: ribulose-phosphate 3-epimerase [Planctomycetales bacterium]|nr:ribulose-phosphate 3-epimerase [Planctomycetales bacterium]
MSRRDHLQQLRDASPAILPSLLICDFGNLAREVELLAAAGVRALHLDVMDGRFVPNLTYGMPIVEGLRRLTDMTLDVHLMIEEPERYVQAFFDAGADLLTIHVEATADPGAVLSQIRELGMGAGAAINPSTPLSQLTACLDQCDLALVMSVEAGFGGQSFHPEALARAREVRQLAPDVLLEMDGGINQTTIQSVAEADVDLMVVGSAIFRAPTYIEAVDQLTSLARAGARGRAS